MEAKQRRSPRINPSGPNEVTVSQLFYPATMADLHWAQRSPISTLQPFRLAQMLSHTRN